MGSALGISVRHKKPPRTRKGGNADPFLSQIDFYIFSSHRFLHIMGATKIAKCLILLKNLKYRKIVGGVYIYLA
ncbi:hypothetical protein EB001_11785 [bacterium]|nr:hypothetical protein [bacterium]